MESGYSILLLLAFIQVICGQVSITGPPAVEQGTDTVVTCTGGTQPYIFAWRDLSVNPNVLIFNGGEATYQPEETKYLNFNVSENGGTSTLTIRNTLIADEGTYRCSEGTAADEKSLTVEVAHAQTLTVTSTIENNIDMYEATCEAIGGRPNVTISWELGAGGSPCEETEVSYPAAGQDLFSTISVCTFQADDGNDGETLKCVIGGHQVSDLNGEETRALNIHNAPGDDIANVDFQEPDPDLRVSCNIKEADQPTPTIRNYYIYSNGTLIHESTTGVNFKVVLEADFDLFTDFICVAGNYLGNTTSKPKSYGSSGTTTPSPTEPITTEGSTTGPPATEMTSTPMVKGPGTQTGTPASPASTTPGEKGTAEPRTPGLGIGAIIGIVIGALLVIIVIVVLLIVFVLKPDCVSGFRSSSRASSGPKKHGSSSVGSSNGNEKDKMKPTPTPRVQSSITHTHENPGNAEYAMVDRKPKPGGGGDMPDTRGNGAGQNDHPGMHYADLDLTANAGHTEREVPQNPENVVVYSSILV